MDLEKLQKRIEPVIEPYIKKIDEKLSTYPLLNELENSTKIKKTYFVFGITGFLALMIIMNFAGNLFANLIGFIYPCYRSFQVMLI